MNSFNENNDPVADELTRHRLAAPGPALEGRVLRAARDEWESDEVAWMIPVFRFAATVVVAALLIALANRRGSGYATARDTPAPRVTPAIPELDVSGASLVPRFVLAPDRNASRRFLEQRRRLRELLCGSGREKMHEG